MSEEIAFSAGPRPLWGSLEWTVEIRIRPDLTSTVIFRSRQGDVEELSAESIEALTDELMGFAERHDIIVFERKVAVFLAEYIQGAGLDINPFDLLEALRKRREAKAYIPADEIDEDPGFQSGGAQPVWGSLVWSLEMKVKAPEAGLPGSEILVLLTNSQTGERHKVKVPTVRDAVLAYREFFENADLMANERRLARLLAEYFPKIGFRPRFAEVLAYFRDPAEAIMTEVEQAFPAEELSQLEETLKMENTLPSVERVQLKDDLTRDEFLGVLNHLLDKATPEENLEIETKCRFTVDGELKETQFKGEAKAGTSRGSDEAQTTLENTFDSPMVAIEIVDILPFDLQLLESKSTLEMKPTKEITSDGLSVIWSVPELEKGEKFSIDYRFLRRISRAMVINSGEYVDTITTYHSIKEIGKGSQQSFRADIFYINSIREQLDEIHVRDIIPREFIVAHATCKSSEEEDIGLRHEVDAEVGTHIEWILQDIPKGSTMTSVYDLHPHPYAVLSRGSMALDNGDKLFFARIFQPSIGINEWVVTHSVILEGQGTHNLEIIEPIPDDFSVVEALSSDPDFERQTWGVKEETQKAVISSFILYPFERSTLSYRIRGESDFNPYQEISLSLSEEEIIKISSEFTHRTQSFFSPPPEHLKLLRSRQDENPGRNHTSRKKTEEDKPRILTGNFSSET